MAAHLVFIPSPGAGHLFSAVELAKLLVNRDHRLSVSILIMAFPGSTKAESFASSLEPLKGITYVHLSHDGYTPDTAFFNFIDFHKPQVRDFLADSIRSESTRLAGVVLDMFCAGMIDVADEIGVPSYIFLPSGAGFLCLAFHALDQDLTQFMDSDSELVIPGFVNSVPANVLPIALTHSEWSVSFLSLVEKFKRTKGILVNTFFELQSYAITYLSENDTIPSIYPVGPVINLNGGSHDSQTSKSESIIIGWLDNQPKSSVVFLCFGSMGTFDAEQVTEIAHALENSGTQFLWSLRRPPPKGQLKPDDYEDVAEALPEGFLERTAEIGKVIGWAPQTAVLSHPAIGGFISHCGWNSSLESIWFGVPVATWPLSAEQQLNAFELVRDLGIAVELKLDYRKDFGSDANYLVHAKEIEKAIKQLMEVSKTDDSLIKTKLQDMSKKSRIAMSEGGSSYTYLNRFIEAVIGTVDSKK